MTTVRHEKDSMGAIDVPADKLWGAQTQRSLEHFRISTEKMPVSLIQALALTKRAAAKVNQDLGLLTADKATAIINAADEVLAGKHPDEFPLAIWQTGSGTQSNMNMNEVLANRASELLGGVRGMERKVHPNDDVNKSQSSNDVFPTAMHVAAVIAIREQLIPQLNVLKATLNEKAQAFRDIVKIGRTHLQDATPLTLGHAINIAGLIQATSHWLLTARPYKHQERDFLLYRFNRFQACRYGLEGILTDVHTGEHKTVAEDIAWLLEQVAPSAEKLGATSAVNEIALLLKQGKSEAQRMREFIADGGSLISLVQKHCELWATSP